MDSLIHSFNVASSFSAYLGRVAEDSSLGDGRFPARNFLLEFAVPSTRASDYTLDWSLELPDDTPATWNAHHQSYLSSHVQTGSRVDRFDQGAARCPQTFSEPIDLSTYGGSDPSLFLVRIENARAIARMAAVEAREALELLRIAAESSRDVAAMSPDKRRRLAGILDAWQLRCDARPMFVGFWEDARLVLDTLTEHWASDVRDRLGLVHFDPAVLGPIDVVVFRYPVSLVPRRTPNERWMVRPTVLDGGLSPAFYSAPSGSEVGSTVDLGAAGQAPWREAVHPAVRLGVEHVFAVEQNMTSGITRRLDVSRGSHALRVVVDLGGSQPEYQAQVQSVDGDLI